MSGSGNRLTVECSLKYSLELAVMTCWEGEWDRGHCREVGEAGLLLIGHVPFQVLSQVSNIITFACHFNCLKCFNRSL